MRTKWLPAILLAGVSQALAGDTIPWARDYEHAQTKAAASGRLIMIDFWAEW